GPHWAAVRKATWARADRSGPTGRMLHRKRFPDEPGNLCRRPGRTLPLGRVGLAQLPAQDLANVALGEFRTELHVFRMLVAREVRAGVGLHLGLGERRMLAGDDHLDGLARLFI